MSSVSEKNECFNTEQGPYDNGKLWCQTASVALLNKDYSYEDIGKIFSETTAVRGLKTSMSENYGVKRYSVTASDITCRLSLINRENKLYGGDNYGVLAGVSRPALSVSCADRAKAKHYPYTD